MDNKKNGIPKLRFPGFTGAWEQRKLGEVATRVTRKNKNLESTLPLTISAQLGLVDQISYFDKRIASSNLTNYILLNRGEFAYNKSYSNGYPFGAVKRLNRYDKGVIPSLYIAFMPNTIFINSDFMEMYFETSLWHKEVSARASEGARNHGLLNISPSDFMDIYMKIPEKIEEQKKIAKFLEDFDSLIALHQRKLEHLQEQKKGLLQKMFPKNGETVPEVRFPGFTDAWEQRKLGEVVKITMGQSPSSKNYTDNSSDYILVQGNADMKNGRVVPRVWTTQITRQAEKGDLILSVRAPVGDIGKTDYDVVIGRGVAAIKGNEYIFQILTKMNNSGYWTRFSTGSTFESINSSNIRNAQIMIPKDDEQTKIGHFLSRFDSLIALHQRKLDHLELMKKGLLQQMFV